MYVTRNRFVELIAWLSVCLLAAAWGPTMDEGVRHLWTIFGLFGLVASAGLEAVQRVRQLQERQRERKQALVRYENAMEEIQRQKRVDAEVREATRRIAEFAATRDAAVPQIEVPESAGERGAANRRVEKRTKCSLPVEILVHDRSGRLARWAENDSHRAYIRDISPSGIGLLHNKPLQAHRVVLRVSLENESVTLSVALLWCRPTKNGWFSSGGKVAEVLSAVDAHPVLPRTEQSSASHELVTVCAPWDDSSGRAAMTQSTPCDV